MRKSWIVPAAIAPAAIALFTASRWGRPAGKLTHRGGVVTDRLEVSGLLAEWRPEP